MQPNEPKNIGLRELWERYTGHGDETTGRPKDGVHKTPWRTLHQPRLGITPLLHLFRPQDAHEAWQRSHARSSHRLHFNICSPNFRAGRNCHNRVHKSLTQSVLRRVTMRNAPSGNPVSVITALQSGSTRFGPKRCSRIGKREAHKSRRSELIDKTLYRGVNQSQAEISTNERQIDLVAGFNATGRFAKKLQL